MSAIWRPLGVVPAICAIIALASVGLMLPIPPAAAHTDLIGSDPQEDAQLDEVPQELQLEFSDSMDPGLSTVALQVGGGRSSQLQLRSGANRNVLLATVPPSLQPEDATSSEWKATFRVVSRDGHPVVGTLAFTVRASIRTRPSATPSSTSLPSDDASSEPSPSPSEAPDPGVVDPSGGPARGDTDAWPLVAVGVGALGLLILAVGATMRLVGRDRDA